MMRSLTCRLYLPFAVLLLAASMVLPVALADEIGAAGSATQPAVSLYTPKDYKAPSQRVQFVVFGDRNGGEVPGIMAPAIELVNRLHPEFVLSVGDQIPGYVDETKLTPDQARQRIRDMWKEQYALFSKLQVPYYWVPGNHDYFSKTAAEMYRETVGSPYYSFDVKGIHIITLNTEQTQVDTGKSGGLDAGQLEWLKQDLARSKGAALTVISMHKPLWKTENGEHWVPVEPLLAGRNCIVFGGHLHTYSYELRNGIPHIVVAAVAGVMTEDPLDAAGHFRHVTLVTVEDGKPNIALIKLNGAPPADVAAAGDLATRMGSVVKGSRLDYPPGQSRRDPLNMTWTLSNPADAPVAVEASWAEPAWQIEPGKFATTLAPGEVKRVEFQATRRLRGGSDQPTLRARLSWPDLKAAPVEVSWQAEPLREMKAASLAGIEVDGKVDAAWADVPAETLTSARQFETGGQYYEGPKDLSVSVRAAINGHMLYLLAEIQDDSVVPNGDEVLFNLSPSLNPKAPAQGATPLYQFAITPGKEPGKAKVTWYSKDKLEATGAWSRQEAGWVAEFAVDIQPVLDKSADKTALPFNFVVCDDDKNQPGSTFGVWCGTRATSIGGGQSGVLRLPAAPAAAPGN